MIKKLIIICTTIGLMSCASAPLDLSKEVDGYDYLQGIESNKYSGAVFGNDENQQQGTDKEQFEFYPGTGKFIDLDAAKNQQKAVSHKGEITLNFEGDPLPMVVNLILGKILKENYVIAPGVSGAVTFATVKPINKDQILPILEMLLSWNNAALVYIEDRYHVMPRAQAIKGNLIPSYGQMEIRNGYTVMVVPLKYIAPSEMEKVLAPYAKDGSIVKADNARNLLFLSGTKRELAMYLSTINIFDVDWLEGMSTGIFTLNRVEAATIVAEMEAIFGEGADNPLAGMFRFMPLERLNAIMVITPQEQYLHKAKEWIMRLDRADSEASRTLYVYNVKNIKADDLAGYLNDVFGGSSGSSSRKSSSGKVAPGLRGKEIGSKNKKSKKITSNKGSSNKDGIKFTAIEENNQILISANAQEYDSILAAVSQLDIEPSQVLIEAKIIEVKLEGRHEFGIQWEFEGSAIDPEPSPRPTLKGFAGLSDTISSSLGSSLNYVLTGADIRATISALESSGNATVLSTPSLLVLNNKEASINVGEQIPIPTFSSGFNNNNNNNNNNNIRSSVTYKQTGIKLQVKPRINPGGLVYIELTQEVSSPGIKDPDTNNIPIDNRDITTEVAIQSGHTVVMGGLIKETKLNSKTGIPVLSKIPLVGSLFGSNTSDSIRTELLVLITPTVIENPEQAKQLTKEYAKQFKGLKPIKSFKDKYEDDYKHTEKNNQKETNEQNNNE
ncbi:General secretion pathway protein D [hydrothermal vent metagenome]|uniref:General secretion pathway protein D n=1 Tax=hydrothermal vent metagenome TaxID=652676 RepID=A0A3B0VDL6_9ZZZZ